MTTTQFDDFYAQYQAALDDGHAALFAGAGLSQASGYVNWKDLLRDIATDLSLDVDKETDLVALAQYHVNSRSGRSRLNSLLVEEFTKNAAITENHRLIATLPIRTVWTTNYDTLLEDAFRQAFKRPDVKITQDNLSITLPHHDVTLYKMHGDVSQPQDAILTKEDYETYHVTRDLFSTKLRGDLVDKTFLFLGFSFTDPNIDYILSRIRSLMGPKSQREHFCILRRPQRPKGRGKKIAEFEYETRKLDLRIGDLKRYGIQAILIDDYGEITSLLHELNRRAHRKGVFVSGSAHDFGPLGRDRVEELASSLAREVIKRGYNLVSGFGLGIGSAVVMGAVEVLLADERADISSRTTLRPFPREALPTEASWETIATKYRQDMIARAGFAVFLCGSKLNAKTGQTVTAGGVLEEFDIAKRLGKYPIPIGATGHAAKEIWEVVINSLDEFYPMGGVKGSFEILGNPRKTTEQLVSAVFAIIKRAVPR